MFEFIKRIWREVKRMFTTNEIKKVLGDVALTSNMVKHIELWNKMLDGSAEWLKDFPSLGVEAGICREFADITINEMEASVDNEVLDKLFKSVIKDLNENLQEGLALGSFIIKPFADGTVEFVSANNIIPITFDKSGRLIDCALIQRKDGQNSGEVFYRVERHSIASGNLTITNKAYRGTEGSFGREIPLNSIVEWSNLMEEVTYLGMDKMDFGYYKNPVKNRIDSTYCGVSIFDSAVELIQKADIQGARVDWEYESGERAIHIDDRALKNNKMARLNKRLYRGLNLDQKEGELLKEYSPQMRDDSFRQGLEDYLRRIEFNVGLAYGDLSNAEYVEKTATEIKTAKQRKYNRVTSIQENLKECLEGLVDALAFYSAKYTSGYTFICSFKDSILTDEEAERKQDREDVAMGVMGLDEYRAKWYGEDLETAKKNLPETTGVLDNLSLK